MLHDFLLGWVYERGTLTVECSAGYKYVNTDVNLLVPRSGIEPLLTA